MDLVDTPADQPLPEEGVGERGGDGHHPDRGPTPSNPFDDLEAGVDIGPDLPSLPESIVQIDHRTVERGQVPNRQLEAPAKRERLDHIDGRFGSEYLSGAGPRQQIVVEYHDAHRHCPS